MNMHFYGPLWTDFLVCRWLSSNRSCPVCRQPADRDRRRPDDGDDGDTPQGPQGPSRRAPPPDPCSAQSQTQQQRPQRLDDAMWQAELAYRLHGMHRYAEPSRGVESC